MKKLLQISIEVNSNSVGRIAEQIGQVAISHGWESYITYARNHQPSKSHVIKIGNKFDIYWHGLMTRLFDSHCLHSTRATEKLIKTIDSIKPDIIQLHHIHGYFLNMKVLFNYLSSINTPLVWVFHDCWSFTGHCAHFDYIGCDKWKSGCYSCILKNQYPSSLFFDRSKENYIIKKKLFTSVNNMTIVPVSYWLADLVKESFLCKFPIKVIQNGINTNSFSPVSDQEILYLRKQLNLTNEIVLLGVASTWCQRKGLSDFVELSKIIPMQWKIILIGLDAHQIDSLPHNIIGLKRTESVHQLSVFYSLASVFINPTWEDTFPTTNLESLACGTPIITYRTGGSVESVDSKTGIVVDKGSILQIVDGVYQILSFGKKYYSDYCRQRAIALYDMNDKFNDYIKLYDSLL